MNSRIQDLESSLGALEKDLKRVHDREAAAKLAAENATEQINQFKEEAKGILGVTCVFFGFPICLFPLWIWGVIGVKASLSGQSFAVLQFEIDGNTITSIVFHGNVILSLFCFYSCRVEIKVRRL